MSWAEVERELDIDRYAALCRHWVRIPPTDALTAARYGVGMYARDAAPHLKRLAPPTGAERENLDAAHQDAEIEATLAAFGGVS